MEMNTNMELKTIEHLSDQQTEAIYRRKQRLYWETDFVNRCIDRRLEETGLCNLPYETLPDEQILLAHAYEIYAKLEDCNTAYNVTLDLVIDEIEQMIKAAEPIPSVAMEPEVRE